MVRLIAHRQAYGRAALGRTWGSRTGVRICRMCVQTITRRRGPGTPPVGAGCAVLWLAGGSEHRLGLRGLVQLLLVGVHAPVAAQEVPHQLGGGAA